MFPSVLFFDDVERVPGAPSMLLSHEVVRGSAALCVLFSEEAKETLDPLKFCC